jgi:hypothetical protein
MMSALKRNADGQHIPICVTDYIFEKIDKDGDNKLDAKEYESDNIMSLI